VLWLVAVPPNSKRGGEQQIGRRMACERLKKGGTAWRRAVAGRRTAGGRAFRDNAPLRCACGAWARGFVP